MQPISCLQFNIPPYPSSTGWGGGGRPAHPLGERGADCDGAARGAGHHQRRRAADDGGHADRGRVRLQGGKAGRGGEYSKFLLLISFYPIAKLNH